jgi:hypothetical protein
MDIGVARAGEPFLSQGRAAGGEQDRHVDARRVEDAAERVGGADADMHHDRRHPPRGRGIAVRHRHREVLVRREERLRRRQPGVRRLGVGLDDRGEIGAGIGEQIFDAAVGEQRQIRLGDAGDLQFFPAHAIALFRCHCDERSDEAISSRRAPAARDCVASLAMTTRRRGPTRRRRRAATRATPLGAVQRDRRRQRRAPRRTGRQPCRRQPGAYHSHARLARRAANHGRRRCRIRRSK